MSNLKTLGRMLGLVASETGTGVNFTLQLPALESNPEIAPIFTLRRADTFDALQTGDEEAEIVVHASKHIISPEPSQVAYRFQTAFDAVYALKSQAFIALAIWELSQHVSSESEEDMINSYCDLPSSVDDVKDDLDLTMCQISDLILAVFNGKFERAEGA
jgi:hypothetical protein